MNYYCYTISFKAQPDLDFFEIVPAWLAEAGFDSFTEGKEYKGICFGRSA
jgi:hypothetical protein